MLQHRVLLLLVAALAVTCLARPTHHVPKIEKDLEEIENDVDDAVDDDDNAAAADNLDAEEEEEAEISVSTCAGERQADDLLAALDAGSSGTKMFLYATDGTLCPAAPLGHGSCKETYIKFFPTMSQVSATQWVNAFDSTGGPSRIHASTDLADSSVADRVKYVMAFATAGNRIIPSATNSTAWGLMTSQIGQYNIKFVGKPETIPGTHEAFLEYKATQRLSFVSMGGASAQAGFTLDSAPKWNNWKELVMSPLHGTYKLPSCNNQNDPKHFVTAILKGSTTYTPIDVSDYDDSCKTDFKCVGLVSWLGGPSVGTTAPACPTKMTVSSVNYETHLVGGNDRAQDLLANSGEQTKTDCFTSPDAEACVRGMEAFSARDLTMKKVRAFVDAVKSATGTFSMNIIASLRPAVKIYGEFTDKESFEEAFLGTGDGWDDEKQQKKMGGARFAAWGVHGILIPLGFVGGASSHLPYHFASARLLPFIDANWIASEAAEAGFPVACAVHFKPETYLDGTRVAAKECVSFLDKTTA